MEIRRRSLRTIPAGPGDQRAHGFSMRSRWMIQESCVATKPEENFIDAGAMVVELAAVLVKCVLAAPSTRVGAVSAFSMSEVCSGMAFRLRRTESVADGLRRLARKELRSARTRLRR